MLKLLSISSLALVALTACMDEREYVNPVAPAQGDFTNSGMVSDPGFERGSLVGDLGPVNGFNDPNASVNGQLSDGFGGSNITVTGVGRNGTGFMILNVYNLDLQRAPAGTYTTQSVDSSVDVTICSDTSDTGDHFDGPTENATIQLTDVDQGHRDIVVNSTISHDDGYSSFSQQTSQTASFRIQR